MEEITPYLHYLIIFVLAVIVILWIISIFLIKTEKMSVKEWGKRSLGLPQGTVRALIAFILLFLLVSAVVTGETFPDLPEWLIGILGTVIGFYFGSALAPKTPEKEEPGAEKKP